MALNIPAILIGLEQLYDNESLRLLRLYIQNPLSSDSSDNIERVLPLLKLIELNGYSNDLLNQIKVTVLDVTDVLSIFKILSICGLDDPFIKNLSKSLVLYPALNWNDALSKGQLFSKLWLVDELKNLDLDLGTVFVCAGWFGTLPALIFKDGNLKYNVFRSFDIDETCADAADSLNRDPYVMEGWKFKATTEDIFNINYQNHLFQCWSKANNRMSYPNETVPDTIINTSCDHIDPFSKWWDMIPNNKLVVLQNNDSKIDDDHVNNINSLEEMKAQAPMEKILFEGVLRLPDYNRFMLIGYK